jgi:hypothetical protein
MKDQCFLQTDSCLTNSRHYLAPEARHHKHTTRSLRCKTQHIGLRSNHPYTILQVASGSLAGLGSVALQSPRPLGFASAPWGLRSESPSDLQWDQLSDLSSSVLPSDLQWDLLWDLPLDLPSDLPSDM